MGKRAGKRGIFFICFSLFLSLCFCIKTKIGIYYVVLKIRSANICIVPILIILYRSRGTECFCCEIFPSILAVI